MPRYAAFLRGVSPMNAKMPELKRAFEREGFTNVVTVISSGNVVFDAERTPVRTLERRAEAAMQRHLGRVFLTIVRPVEGLKALIGGDPYAAFVLPKQAKRTVTFLRTRPPKSLRLPMDARSAQLLAMQGGAIFAYYIPGPDAQAFMPFLERVLGKEITTRTIETVMRVSEK